MSIKIDLKIFAFALIYIFTRQLHIYAILLLFAFIHECTHMITGLFLGLKPESIKISPYGFSIHFKTKENKKFLLNKNSRICSLKKIIIAVSGPIMNLIIAIIAYEYSKKTGNGLIFNLNIDEVIYSNVVLAFFNLLPIYPLDGGRVLKEIMLMYKDYIDTAIMTNTISKICAFFLTMITSLIVLKYNNIILVFIIVYIWIITLKNNYQTELVKKVYKNLKQ